MRTAYLDTAHWIDLACHAILGNAFERAVAARRIVPILSLAHLIEFAAIEDSARRGKITEFLDHLDMVGEMRWIKHLYAIIRLEALECFQEVMSGRWTRPGVFAESFHGTLPDSEDWRFDLETPHCIRDFVETVRQDAPFMEGFREDRREHPALRRGIARTRRARRASRFSDEDCAAGSLMPIACRTESVSRVAWFVGSTMK